ncbi:hypothetical protein Efla_001636 [Eimeria flavescens]
MEYDEQVSARLHMSLDEIIGQEQQDEPSQAKKRKARRAAPGTASPHPATTSASSSRPASLPTAESVSRYSAPLPASLGGVGGFPSRPSPTVRPLPALMRAPPGRLPGPPPFSMGAAPPFHLPPGHPRMDSTWQRARHLCGGYLMPPNGFHRPPPPAGPGMRPPRVFPMPPRPGGNDVGYTPRRPLVGPYGDPRSMHPCTVALLMRKRTLTRRITLWGATTRLSHRCRLASCLLGWSRRTGLCRVICRWHTPLGARRLTSGTDMVRVGGPLPVRPANAPIVNSVGAPQTERREFTVIVSNVPKDLPAVEIQEAFSCMGTILRTDIMLNSKGEHTGRVCIVYASAQAAKTAVAQFDEGDLNGNTIRVFAE